MAPVVSILNYVSKLLAKTLPPERSCRYVKMDSLPNLKESMKDEILIEAADDHFQLLRKSPKS